MSYSIKPILGDYKNSKGLQKVVIRVIYNRKKYYAETDIRVKTDQFDGVVKKHPHALMMNGILKDKIHEIESRLLIAIHNKTINEKIIVEIVKGKNTDSTSIEDYKNKLIEQLTGKISHNRIKHLRSVLKKFTDWENITFNSITVDVLNNFEAHIRKSVSGNTVFANMKMLKSFLIKAKSAGLIKAEQYQDYKVPPYTQNLPVYLTENEIMKFQNLVETIDNHTYKIAGYYFLFSCMTGYRISDAKRFNYQEMITDGQIVLRAKKNGSIVSIPIHTNLEKVLRFVKDNPFSLSEGKTREYIKEIGKLAGIKKKFSYHASRHSWAMLLMSKGFSIDEVAETLGDSVNIARIYARISNEQLSNKIKEKLNQSYNQH